MIQKTVQDPLAQMLLAGEIRDGETVKIGVSHGALTFNGKPAAGSPEEPAPAKPATRGELPQGRVNAPKPGASASDRAPSAGPAHFSLVSPSPPAVARRLAFLRRRRYQASGRDRSGSDVMNNLSAFLGGSPAMVALRLIVVSFIVGMVLVTFGFDPANIIDSFVNLVHRLIEYGLTDFREIGRVLATGRWWCCRCGWCCACWTRGAPSNPSREPRASVRRFDPRLN